MFCNKLHHILFFSFSQVFEFGIGFTLKAHLSLASPHFKCSVVTIVVSAHHWTADVQSVVHGSVALASPWSLLKMQDIWLHQDKQGEPQFLCPWQT